MAVRVIHNICRIQVENSTLFYLSFQHIWSVYEPTFGYIKIVFFITPRSRFDNTLNWLCCDQLGYKFLCFSRFSPSLQYVKFKKALNMEALLKTRLHRLDVPDISRLHTQCSTQYHPDCWNLAELGSFWWYNLGYHLHWAPSMRWHSADDISQW